MAEGQGAGAAARAADALERGSERIDLGEVQSRGKETMIGYDPGPEREQDAASRWILIVAMALIGMIIGTQIGIAVGWIEPGWMP